MSQLPPRPDVPGAGWGPPPPPGAPTQTRAAPRLDIASPGKRFLGILLDWLVFSPVSIVLFFVTSRDVFDELANVRTFSPADFRSMFADWWWSGLGITALWFLYRWLMISWRGQTLGKMAVGTRVVRAIDGGRVDAGGAAIRAAVESAGALVPGAGGIFGLLDALWLFGNERRQTIHDVAARTVVVNATSSPP